MPFGLRYGRPKPPNPKRPSHLVLWIIGLVAMIAMLPLLDPLIEREGKTIAAVREIDQFVHALL